MVPILFSLTTFISTLCGGLLSLKYKDKLHYIMSFSVGVILAVCFFDILPEIVNITNQRSLNLQPSLIAIVCGFLTLYILEKLALMPHVHEEDISDHKHPHIGLISALGLCFHSFLDGVGIGLGFHISNQIGIIIAIAVIAHDFTDGLNTVTLMLLSKNTNKKAFILLVIDAIAPVLGALFTMLFTISEHILVVYLGFFMGFILYIGASELLPEVHSKKRPITTIGLTIIGVLFIFLVTKVV